MEIRTVKKIRSDFTLNDKDEFVALEDVEEAKKIQVMLVKDKWRKELIEKVRLAWKEGEEEIEGDEQYCYPMDDNHFIEIINEVLGEVENGKR